MSENQKYTIFMEPNFGFLKLIDTQKLIDDCTEKWFNQTLCEVNDCIIRLGVFNEGEFHWHKHDHEDEFFLVIKGELFIEFHEESLLLKQHQAITIPKGTLHRTFVKQPTAVIMVEGKSVIPTGDK